MDCPYCDASEQKGSRVIDTRSQKSGGLLRRRRECLSGHKHRFTTFETIADEDAIARAAAPEWRSVPREHEAIGHRFSIAGHEGLINAGKYEDGTVGEVTVGEFGKEGSTMAGLLNAFAKAISIALQYGIPLEVLVKSFTYMRFEPEGITKNPEIPFAKSIPDYIMRWLASRFIDDPEFLWELGIQTPEVKARQEQNLNRHLSRKSRKRSR